LRYAYALRSSYVVKFLEVREQSICAYEPHILWQIVELQEGQHPLTGQRAANFRRDLEAT